MSSATTTTITRPHNQIPTPRPLDAVRRSKRPAAEEAGGRTSVKKHVMLVSSGMMEEEVAAPRLEGLAAGTPEKLTPLLCAWTPGMTDAPLRQSMVLRPQQLQLH